jgi:hypothetical protein
VAARDDERPPVGVGERPQHRVEIEGDRSALDERERISGGVGDLGFLDPAIVSLGPGDAAPFRNGQLQRAVEIRYDNTETSDASGVSTMAPLGPPSGVATIA